MAKTKVDLITTLPSDPVQRDRLKKVRDEALDLNIQLLDIKEQLKDIYKVEKEDHQICPKFLKAMVKRELDVLNAEKKTAAIEAELEAFAEADVLSGRSSGV